MHCEGIMSGELKHGPLAMVDKNRSIVMVICSDNVYNVIIHKTFPKLKSSFTKFVRKMHSCFCIVVIFTSNISNLLT